MILVTGASGFLGARLMALGFPTRGRTALWLSRSRPALSPRRGIWRRCNLGSRRDLTSLHRLLSQVDTVVHLASATPRHREVWSPHTMLQGTAGLTLNLLEALAAARSPVRRVVLASSLDVCGQSDRPLREDSVPGPQTPYAAGKLAAEHLAALECRRRGIRCTILRFSQVYGPGDTSAKAIPAMVARLRANLPPTLINGGRDGRDYVYVDDAIRAIRLALTRPVEGIFHIASGRAVELRRVLDTLISVSGYTGPVIREVTRSRPSSRRVDTRRARRLLGFRTRVNLTDGLARTWRHPQPGGS